MFQNYRDDIIGKTVAFSTVTMADHTAYRARIAANTASLSTNVFGKASGTSTNAYLGAAVAVTDPELRGPMVLSYEYMLSGKANVNAVIPVIFDKQQASSYTSGANVDIVSATDMAYRSGRIQVGQCLKANDGPCNFHGSGKLLVNTSIETATGGVTVRDFGLALIVVLGGTGITYEFLTEMSLRLHSVDELVFQPSK